MASSLPDAWAPLIGADMYLVDQIMRGRIRSGMSVLDVGCGDGRNLPALIAAGCTVSAIDAQAHAVAMARTRVQGCCDPTHLVVGDLETMPFPARAFAVVVVNAVFHFARDRTQFHRWADACWSRLAPGGLFIARLSTRIGLPDASPPGFTFLADNSDLSGCEHRWQAVRADPLKTTLVENLRTMTTWVLSSPR